MASDFFSLISSWIIFVPSSNSKLHRFKNSFKTYWDNLILVWKNGEFTQKQIQDLKSKIAGNYYILQAPNESHSSDLESIISMKNEEANLESLRERTQLFFDRFVSAMIFFSPKYSFISTYFAMSLASGLLFSFNLISAETKTKSGLFSLDAWGAAGMTLFLPILLEDFGMMFGSYLVFAFLLASLALQWPLTVFRSCDEIN